MLRLFAITVVAGLTTSTGPTIKKTTTSPPVRPTSGATAGPALVHFDADGLSKAGRRKLMRSKPSQLAKPKTLPRTIDAFASETYKPGAKFARIESGDLVDGPLSGKVFGAAEVTSSQAAFESDAGHLAVTLKKGPGMYVVSCMVAYGFSQDAPTFEVTNPDGTKHSVHPGPVDWIHMTVEANKDWWYVFEIRADGPWSWWTCEAAPLVGVVAPPG